MDGIHDLGGMHGFGAIEREENEPPFHAEWEGRVFAMLLASGFVTKHGDDQMRKFIERTPPAEYLHSSYYELWFRSLKEIMKEVGAVTAEEIETGKMTQPLPDTMSPGSQARAEGLEDICKLPGERHVEETEGLPHRFNTGDKVRARASMSFGHTRLPRYVRGHVGEVISENGCYIFSDANAARTGIDPQMVYTVAFDAADLFGNEGRAGDTITIDAWDSYLEPV